MSRMRFGKLGIMLAFANLASNACGRPQRSWQAMRVLQHHSFLRLVGRTQTPEKISLTLILLSPLSRSATASPIEKFL